MLSACWASSKLQASAREPPTRPPPATKRRHLGARPQTHHIRTSGPAMGGNMKTTSRQQAAPRKVGSRGFLNATETPAGDGWILPRRHPGQLPPSTSTGSRGHTRCRPLPSIRPEKGRRGGVMTYLKHRPPPGSVGSCRPSVCKAKTQGDGVMQSNKESRTDGRASRVYTRPGAIERSTGLAKPLFGNCPLALWCPIRVWTWGAAKWQGRAPGRRTSTVTKTRPRRGCEWSSTSMLAPSLC